MFLVESKIYSFAEKTYSRPIPPRDDPGMARPRWEAAASVARAFAVAADHVV
jgi:hypothetical protein